MSRFKKGFTLVELLIVVVIIGILAAIAVPKIGEAKEKAYVAAMKSDLRNLVVAMELFFDDNSAYPAGIVSDTLAFGIGADPATPANDGLTAINGFKASSKVTLYYFDADGAGALTAAPTDSIWAVQSKHAQAAGKLCQIIVGRVAAATNQVECTP